MQDPPSVQSLLAEFAGFAASLANILSVGDFDWLWRPEESEWSLTEVICHLRDVEVEVHQERFRKLMLTDNPFLSGQDADPWVLQRKYQLQDGPAALTSFLNARQNSLDILQTIEDEDLWDRSGRHAFFGTTTLHELLNLAVRHDRAHWQQIDALIEAQHNGDSAG